MRPAVLALATVRLTQLVTDDELTAPVRDKVLKWQEQHPYGSWQDRLGYLVGCGRCTSVWAAAAILAGSRLALGRPFIAGLALSEAAILGMDIADRINR